MIRNLFQSTLVFALSPLLIAQQAAPPASGAALPAQVEIDLTGRAWQIHILSTGKIRRGSTIQFQLSADATYGNETLIPAGVAVNGVVTEVKRSVRSQQRDGQIAVKVTETVAGKATDVLVRCSNPADPYDKAYFSDRASRYAPLAGVIAVTVALIVIGTHREK